jgi:hypothetical protein
VSNVLPTSQVKLCSRQFLLTSSQAVHLLSIYPLCARHLCGMQQAQQACMQLLPACPLIRNICLCWHTFVGLARTIYIPSMYGIIGREIAKHTVIYGAYIRFWPTLHICLTNVTNAHQRIRFQAEPATLLIHIITFFFLVVWCGGGLVVWWGNGGVERYSVPKGLLLLSLCGECFISVRVVFLFDMNRMILFCTRTRY